MGREEGGARTGASQGFPRAAAPVLGKTEGRRRSGQQRMRWLDGITDSIGVAFQAPPGSQASSRGLNS